MTEVTNLADARNLRQLRKFDAGQLPSKKEAATRFFRHLEKAGHGDIARHLHSLLNDQGEAGIRAWFMELAEKYGPTPEDGSLPLVIMEAFMVSMGFDASGESHAAIAQQGHDADAPTGNTDT